MTEITKISADLTPVEEVATAIRERTDRFEQNFLEKNAEQLVADYYVNDELKPVVSAPDLALLEGHAPIAELFQGLMQTFSSLRLEQINIYISGDMAQELGRCVIKDDSGETSTARYSITWRKTEDGWRVQTDFFAFGDLI